MYKQRGMSLTSMAVVLVLSVALGIASLRFVTPYLKALEIENVFKSVANSEELRHGSHQEIREAINKQLSVNDITEITASDVDIKKDEDGMVLESEYEKTYNLNPSIKVVITYSLSSQ